MKQTLVGSSAEVSTRHTKRMQRVHSRDHSAQLGRGKIHKQNKRTHKGITRGALWEGVGERIGDHARDRLGRDLFFFDQEKSFALSKPFDFDGAARFKNEGIF